MGVHLRSFAVTKSSTRPLRVDRHGNRLMMARAIAILAAAAVVAPRTLAAPIIEADLDIGEWWPGSARIRFERGQQPLIVAHQFCSRNGILSFEKCAKVAASVRRAAVEYEVARESYTGVGLYLERPVDGDQFYIGEKIPLLATFLQPESFASGGEIEVCVDVHSIQAELLTEHSTTQCFQSPLLSAENTSKLFVNAIAFPGYHQAVVRIHSPGTLAVEENVSASFTTVSPHAGAPPNYFAMTMEKSVMSEPMAARGMVYLDEELLFKSTGTSNPGRNYPGIWLPSAGIAPRFFLYGDIMSFRDINLRGIDEENGTVLRHNAPSSAKARLQLQKWVKDGQVPNTYAIVDKRFHLAKKKHQCLQGGGVRGDFDNDGVRDPVCIPHVDFDDDSTFLKSSWKFDKSLASLAGSIDDVQSGEFIFGRFYSLKSMSVSVRLSPSAWRANGYWPGAVEILKISKEKGYKTEPSLVDYIALNGEERHVVGGMCDANSFIHSNLGFSIDGWEDFSAAVCQ